MTGLTPLILIFGAAGMFLAALFYIRDEVRVRGRWVLLSLRLASLLLVVLLLLDLRLPSADGARGEGGEWLLLDPDLSLVVPGDADRTLWEEGVARASEESRNGMRLALATPGNRGPEGIDTSSLLQRGPDHPPGDLAEGVLRLGESGADSILVLSTFRIPPEELGRVSAVTPVPIRLERLGGPTRNVGVGELSLPGYAPVDEEVEGAITIFGEGGSPADSVDLQIDANGEMVYEVRLPLPPAGTERTERVLLPPPPLGATLVRYSARVTFGGDVFPIDDQRARWVTVGEEDGGILLLSLRPDWEPRVLLPLLETVTGLPGEGYLALGGGRFLPLAEGSEEVEIVGEEAFRDRIPRARILVLDGGAREIEGWLDALVRSHPRVVHLPDDPIGAALVAIRVDEPWEGEWVLESDVPASPVSPFLSGTRLAGLPPLGSLLPVTGDISGTVALRVRRSQVGEALPVLVFRETPAGRRAVVLADGLWRWGSRDGDSREAYRGIWGGVADWLLSATDPVAGALVTPLERVAPRGEPLRWVVAGGSLAITLDLLPIDVDPTGRWDTQPSPSEGPTFHGSLVPDEDGVATTAVMAPGLYRYEVRDAEAVAVVASGVVEVEGWAPSLRHEPLEVDGLVLPAATAVDSGLDGGGRPLRAHPFPYLLLILLLSAEWLGRRAVGLR